MVMRIVVFTIAFWVGLLLGALLAGCGGSGEPPPMLAVCSPGVAPYARCLDARDLPCYSDDTSAPCSLCARGAYAEDSCLADDPRRGGSTWCAFSCTDCGAGCRPIVEVP